MARTKWETLRANRSDFHTSTQSRSRRRAEAMRNPGAIELANARQWVSH